MAVIYPAEASLFAALPGGHVAPGTPQRWRPRVIRETWRELIAPDGSVHRVCVPLVRLELDPDGEAEPRRRQPPRGHPGRRAPGRPERATGG